MMNKPEEIAARIKKGAVLFYAGTENCGICRADKPRIKKMAENWKISLCEIDPIEHPKIRAAYCLFTSPVIILFFDGKELHRQARIIDFKELEYRIKQLQESLD